jgi:hypothetical protein
MAAIDAVSPGEPPAQPTKIIRANIGAASAAAPAPQALIPTETPVVPSGG